MYSKKSSFGLGELDPSLHERTDLESYFSGLKTARNVLIGKTGRIINMAGTWFNTQTKDNDDVNFYVPKVPFFAPTINPALIAATWTRSGTTVTVTEVGHGLTLADFIVVTVTSDETNVTYGIKDITVLDADTFTFTSVNTGTTSGTLSYRIVTGEVEATCLLEFGDGYVRGYALLFDLAATRYKTIFFDEKPTDFAAADLSKLRFETVKEKQTGLYKAYISGGWLNSVTSVYISSAGLTVDTIGPEFPRLEPDGSSTPTYKDLYKIQTGVDAQLGVRVQYGLTVVTKSGLESPIYEITTHTGSDNNTITFPKLPTGVEYNSFTITNLEVSDTKYANDLSHFNFYRRPWSNASSGRTSYGNGYGLIGQTLAESSYTAGNNLTVSFIDFGQEADFTNPPPQTFRDIGQILNPMDSSNYGVTGIGQYNQRLIYYEKSFLAFSRVNQQQYLLRDFPLTNDTCLILDIGESSPDIYHHANYNGLYVFTSEGIYYGGAESPVSSINPIMKKVNDAVIKKDLKPLVTPFGLFFVDARTNTIKTLIYDDQTKSVTDVEISTFSDHLFYGKEVVDWAFTGGDVPFMFVVLDDGTAVSYIYSKINGVNAWTRHDTLGNYKRVASFKLYDTAEEFLMLLVERNGDYFLETTSSRALYAPATNRDTFRGGVTYRTFSHSSVLHYATYDSTGMGDIVQSKNQWTVVAGADTLWENTVRIVSFVGQYLVDRVGKTFAVYLEDTNDYYYMDLFSATLGGTAVFTITGEAFPSAFRGLLTELIECSTVIDGLDHLENQVVSVIADNVVLGSPNNLQDNLDTYLVTGGEITLPKPRAYTVVGLPYVSDVGTLQLDTKNGSTALDRKLVNEIAVKYIRTRGVYVSNEFAPDDDNTGMEIVDQWETTDTVNAPLAEKTGLKRYHASSTWEKGEICIRQVDPLPMEIGSIILDVSKGG